MDVEGGFENGLKKLLFFGLNDAGEVLRTLGGEGLHGGYPFEGGGGGVGLFQLLHGRERLDDVGDAAVAIDGGFGVAGGAVGSGGGSEIAGAFVALGFELVVAFGEGREDDEGFFEVAGFDEAGDGVGAEFGGAFGGVGQADGVEERREDFDADGGVGTDVLDLFEHGDPAGGFGAEFEEDPGGELGERGGEVAHEVDGGVGFVEAGVGVEVGDFEQGGGEGGVFDATGGVGGLVEEFWVAEFG